MNRQPSAPSQNPPAYVRPSRIEVEPVVFAVALIALVLSISQWRPAPQEPQQAAPVEHNQTLAAAPQS